MTFLLGFILGVAFWAVTGMIVDAIRNAELDRQYRQALREVHTCGPKCTPLAQLHRSEWE